MDEVSILLVGQSDRSEFRQGRDTLQGLGRVASFPDAAAALAALAQGQLVPDVIVIAQSYPGEFSHAAVDCLRQAAPLARVLGLLGSWCEGEMRTGRPWPGAIRIYWHQWPARCQQEFRRLRHDTCGAWALPSTATEEEHWLLPPPDDPAVRRHGLIAIYTPRCEVADWLSAACEDVGYSTVWLRPPRLPRVQGATAAIFDGSNCSPEEANELRHLSAMLDKAPIIALLDFPRIEDHRRAILAGAGAVVSKPLHFDDLLQELDRQTS